ncbi:hypothetical protein [Mycolicibacterium sp.]|uniref:hypothetical protein n=1 Tax=Mycolicibacterium sp. TaxID=2320850 RepID=UPI0028AB71E6|nr:hypothetical protein [Mycolicibacterium sp.]
MASTQDSASARAAFEDYCGRHAVGPDTAIVELVNMALGLPAEVLDYLRQQTAVVGKRVAA